MDILKKVRRRCPMNWQPTLWSKWHKLWRTFTAQASSIETSKVTTSWWWAIEGLLGLWTLDPADETDSDCHDSTKGATMIRRYCDATSRFIGLEALRNEEPRSTCGVRGFCCISCSRGRCPSVICKARNWPNDINWKRLISHTKMLPSRPKIWFYACNTRDKSTSIKNIPNAPFQLPKMHSGVANAHNRSIAGIFFTKWYCYEALIDMYNKQTNDQINPCYSHAISWYHAGNVNTGPWRLLAWWNATRDTRAWHSRPRWCL